MTTITPTPKLVRPENGAIPWQATADLACTVGKIGLLTATGVTPASDATSAGCKGQLAIMIPSAKQSSAGVVAAGDEVSLILAGPVYLGSDITLVPANRYYCGLGGIFTDTVTGFEHAVGYALDTHTLMFLPSVTQPTS